MSADEALARHAGRGQISLQLHVKVDRVSLVRAIEAARTLSVLPPKTACIWCTRGYTVAQRRRGSLRRFCSSLCRGAFHTAARKWAIQALTTGVLTVPELRMLAGEACTLHVIGVEPSALSEEHSPSLTCPADVRRAPDGRLC